MSGAQSGDQMPCFKTIWADKLNMFLCLCSYNQFRLDPARVHNNLLEPMTGIIEESSREYASLFLGSPVG